MQEITHCTVLCLTVHLWGPSCAYSAQYNNNRISAPTTSTRSKACAGSLITDIRYDSHDNNCITSGLL